MDVKSNLRQIMFLDHRIKDNMNKLEEIESQLTKTTPTLRFDAGTSGSVSSDKMDLGVARMIELKITINHEIDLLVSLELKYRNILSKLTSVDYYDVLYKRYFEFKKWEQIAIEMNMTYRNVCYVHGKALKAFESIMQEEGKTDE